LAGGLSPLLILLSETPDVVHSNIGLRIEELILDTRYFNSWFHSFDATVIVAGFIVDVVLHGILEEVASLVVILRLWRFFKIIEEFSVGAEEQMDGLTLRIEQLEMENCDLKLELKKQKGTMDEEQEMGFQSGSGSWK
jgi:hypothetical protein